MQRQEIVAVRAYTVSRGGGDYHAQGPQHWIVGEIATPMSQYPEFRATRTSWGIDVLGTLVVEVETRDGVIGFGVSTGGVPAAWIVEQHLARFVVGKTPWDVETIWDQMYRATLFYGRKGLVLNAISAVDLALWDALGRIRQEPVYAMIGGAVRKALTMYATGPRPDLAQQMGFIGGKLPLPFGPASGEQGLKDNVQRFQTMRERVGEDFWLAYDCWMALDVPYAMALANALAPYRPKWIEECFPPDDVWAYQALRHAVAGRMLVSTGEHEATRWGFRGLLESGATDFIQPDVTWCGGLTELLKISALADAHGAWVIPHGSSVYSYHFVISRANSPFAEFLMMHPEASQVVPMFFPLLEGEPVPIHGTLTLPDRPGFGVELNRALLRRANGNQEVVHDV